MTEIRPSLGQLLNAQEQVRRRLAAEIHDEPMQVLTALHLGLQMLRDREGAHDDRAAVQELQDMAEMGFVVFRRLVSDLRPPPLIDEGFAGALKSCLRSLDANADELLDDRLASEPSLEIATIAYRAVQEIVAALRRAGYGLQGLSLQEADESIFVRIAVVDAAKGDRELLSRIASDVPSRAWIEVAGGTLNVPRGQDAIELRLPRTSVPASTRDQESMG